MSASGILRARYRPVAAVWRDSVSADCTSGHLYPIEHNAALAIRPMKIPYVTNQRVPAQLAATALHTLAQAGADDCVAHNQSVLTSSLGTS